MFIAMNRFRLFPERERFEEVWRNRDTHLEDVPGFGEFHLVKGKKKKAIRFTLHTLSGQAKKPLKIGRNLKPLELRIRMLGRTLICILDIRTLRVLRWLQVFQ